MNKIVGVFGTMFLFFTATVNAEQVVKLQPPELSGGLPLLQALAQRRTTRSFSERPLEQQVLAELLWAACGVNREDGRRTAPSARNWQEIDVYVTLPDGLFLYDAAAHSLVKVKDQDLRALAGTQAFTDTAPLNLVYVAELTRMRGADEQNQVFYSAVDTGFISQNVYLYCASRGLNTVVLGLVNRDQLAEAMGLRPTQRVILSQTVGYPADSKTTPSPLPAAPSAAPTPLKDGVWRGDSKGYVGDIVVDVTVKNGRISEIKVHSQKESAPGKTYQVLPASIIAGQGTAGVDAVTGATVTSKAYLKAVAQALGKSRAGKTE